MKLLLVIDMQNDFINGALGTKEAVAIVKKVQKKIAEYRKQGFPVIFTKDTHKENYSTTQEGKNLPVPHCIENTHGWEIAPEMEVKNAKVITKPTFGSIELAKYIETHYPLAEIELVKKNKQIKTINLNLLILFVFLQI